MKNLKHFLLTIAGCSLFLLTLSANASSAGNWTETFHLKGGNWIMHTPTKIVFDGFMTTYESLDIQSKSFNGTPLTSCGLHVKTDSTKTEFVKALICSGLYPA